MEETIKLIEERGSNLEGITIRDICLRANVGTGLVNYHFQTKENLIAQCVQIIIGDVIRKFDSIYQQLPDVSPLEKLRLMAKATFSFLIKNENISRISILTDLQDSKENDNTSQTVNVYLPLVKAVCPEGMSEKDIKTKTYLLTLALQGVFLRGAVLLREIGNEGYSKEEQDRIIDLMIDTMFI